MSYSEAQAANDHAHHVELMGVLERIARALEARAPEQRGEPVADDGRCGLWNYDGTLGPCDLPRGHKGQHRSEDNAMRFQWGTPDHWGAAEGMSESGPLPGGRIPL